MLRKLAIKFLRSTSANHLAGVLPPADGGTQVSGSKSGVVERLFAWSGRLVGKLLPRRVKVAIQDGLINALRIDVDLVPRAQFRQFLHQGLSRLVAEHGAESLGDYLEFGVYQGASMATMHGVLEELKLDQVRLFGFDSFEGLPAEAEQEGTWTEGQFRAKLEFAEKRLTDAGVNWERTTLVKGYFSDTLTQVFLDENKLQKASVIMVDCDLYSSTREALAFCAPLIQDEALLVFDDWHSTDGKLGQKEAYSEFMTDNPALAAREYSSYAHNARTFLISRRTHD